MARSLTLPVFGAKTLPVFRHFRGDPPLMPSLPFVPSPEPPARGWAQTTGASEAQNLCGQEETR